MDGARIKSFSDEELQYRSQTIMANNKTIVTPIKAIDPTRIDNELNMNKKIDNINELYAGITKIKISDHITNSNNSLSYLLNHKQRKFRNPKKEIQLCFLEYKDESIPTDKEIEFMTDHAYVYSDITPIPMLSKFKDRITNISEKNNKVTYMPNDSKFEKIENYIKESISTINQLNNKPIMGYIPDYRYYFDKLIKIYVDNGINTFYFDAHLSTPITLHISLRPFMRELNKIGALEKSFIHILNPGYGRGIKDSSIIPAKDILGFGLGIDSLGERHMKRRFDKSTIEKMKKNPDNRSRLFNKNSYGYIKTSDKKTIQDFYPNDSEINIKNFLRSKKIDDKIQNTFNIEQLALESMRLRDKIKDKKSVLNYIDKKSDIKQDDIKILKRAKIKDTK